MFVDEDRSDQSKSTPDSWSTLPHQELIIVGKEPKEAVLELFMAKLNCSTLQVFLVNRLKEVVIFPMQEVKLITRAAQSPVSW